MCFPFFFFFLFSPAAKTVVVKHLFLEREAKFKAGGNLVKRVPGARREGERALFNATQSRREASYCRAKICSLSLSPRPVSQEQVILMTICAPDNETIKTINSYEEGGGKRTKKREKEDGNLRYSSVRKFPFAFIKIAISVYN